MQEITTKIEQIEQKLDTVTMEIIKMKTSNDMNNKLLTKLVNNLITTDQKIRSEQYKTWGIVGAVLTSLIAIFKTFF